MPSFLVLVFELVWPNFLELKLSLDSIRPLIVLQYYRVRAVSQSFLQEVGAAKAGTKSIFNGKIEKLKKIQKGEHHIYGPESLFY